MGSSVGVQGPLSCHRGPPLGLEDPGTFQVRLGGVPPPFVQPRGVSLPCFVSPKSRRF